ncbi:conserved mitochondrial Glutathionylspermidine synthase preATP-grasp superfamily member [Andalucia godoyi]|uniref:Conserved mitochondrial Glutathionylspermidine synthase preATP-grasp superfamily member n=1 Tax=Andalucia godoyi TaxID=505711 RepID=A0A8K0AHG7_ANDGO|nr:conserved mitochondrial Glutathionylspermidine synthase preATP-grasp superfamily member [Andalucia godoyi]|eukprot:ANDGO_05938.mRNA.1 conserved mitochondrial Glutathionylspermidine synthase preATP-grasp superfamily member
MKSMLRRIQTSRTGLLVAGSPVLEPSVVELSINDFDDRSYYLVSPTAHAQLAQATTEVHKMAMTCVEMAVNSNEIMDELRVPVEFREPIRASWARGEQGLLGRMDFAWSETEEDVEEGTTECNREECGKTEKEKEKKWLLKFLEYNADTPGSYYETGVLQPEFGRMMGYRTAGDEFVPRLVDALRKRRLPEPFGVLYHPGDAYLANMATFMTDMGRKAGYSVERLAFPEFKRSQKLGSAFKIFRWHAIWNNKFPAVRELLEGELKDAPVMEPAWKYLLQNKGLMVLMWRLFPGHPNLLATTFTSHTDIPRWDTHGYVVKSFHGILGGEVGVFTPEFKTGNVGLTWTGPSVYQEYVHMPCIDGRFPIVSSWTIDGEYGGALIREDKARVTNDDIGLPMLITDL